MLHPMPVKTASILIMCWEEHELFLYSLNDSIISLFSSGWILVGVPFFKWRASAIFFGILTAREFPAWVIEVCASKPHNPFSLAALSILSDVDSSKNVSLQ